MIFISLQTQHKSQMLGFDTPVLAEDKLVKGTKVIGLHPIGGRKEYCIKFDVSLCGILCPCSLSVTILLITLELTLIVSI